jgi:hypothetical protein
MNRAHPSADHLRDCDATLRLAHGGNFIAA